MATESSFHIPESWWGWLIPVALVCGAWLVKTLRDALLQKNAELIVKRLLEPDNSGVSPLQRMIRDEMMREDWRMESLRRTAEAARDNHHEDDAR